MRYVISTVRCHITIQTTITNRKHMYDLITDHKSYIHNVINEFYDKNHLHNSDCALAEIGKIN